VAAPVDLVPRVILTTKASTSTPTPSPKAIVFKVASCVPTKLANTENMIERCSRDDSRGMPATTDDGGRRIVRVEVGLPDRGDHEDLVEPFMELSS
jgi:hypothetical protein